MSFEQLAVLLVSVQGIAVNVDPVLTSWLLFHPQRTSSSRQTQQSIPGTVRSWYHSQACMPGTLVLCLPQISVLSAGHRRMEPLQDVPFTVPRPVLEEGDAFPWTVCVSQLSVYSLLGQQWSLSVFEPVGCTSTLALTAPKLQPDSRDAFIMCLHVDLQPVHLKCSNPQVQLVFGLWCRWSQIFSVFDRMQSRGAQRASAGFPDSSAPPAGPSSPVHSSVGTIPLDTSNYSPSADLGSPTEGYSAHTEDPAAGETMTLEQKTCSVSSTSGKLSIWMQWMLPKLTLQLFNGNRK
ncbi:vacuolar protein sorting-associated protein 13B-like [Sinocyclocheilus anshuiensis]|uniref:vacuolar protein sorting-associated protein 13B-like n=1 Tax=Sinocyclocheilus anshuiensis TaxID=1608454 RepID=UPI0007B98209|nr:PREDICTED: vacuolar protein sorting-associated protein 13B-like [Sinocyclocheilus anshuiensis]